MNKPTLLDLFCGAGGCTKGYQDAGFYVVGVDIDPQPRYVGDEFIQADVMEWLSEAIDSGYTGRFDVIHASPPCQVFSKTKHLANDEHNDLLAATRRLLKSTGQPYVIENVPGAPLIEPMALNGVMFGLRVNRERLFETWPALSFILLPPPMPQAKMGRPPRFDGDFVQPVGHFSAVDYTRDAMDIGWMTRKELSQAIPPAYTEYIGRKMRGALGL